MEIRHLQSLIKRQSNRIADLESTITFWKSIGSPESYVVIPSTKKEIAALAELQKVLKMELRDMIEWKWVEDYHITVEFVAEVSE